VAQTSPSTSLLSSAYQELELNAGRLYSTRTDPSNSRDIDAWESVDEWLMLAERMSAERVFFVGDDPVIVFAELPDSASEEDAVRLYRRAWSLSRPRCLFLAYGGELRVYALSNPPPRRGTRTKLKALKVVERAAEVAEKLSAFHRERVESGLLFDEPAFQRRAGWADERLLRDVKAATARLQDARLSRVVAHTLIERAILVRYLEDRGVITPDYFEGIAAEHPQWVGALAQEREAPNMGTKSDFVATLRNKEFAYAIFADLAVKFNGDLFVPLDGERDVISSDHLRLIHDLLTGTGVGGQQPLFLWAYDFDVVPTSLISSMYEQFYRTEISETRGGTHYTPAELVEYVLAETLSDEVLSRSPRICDPACGSGIFLVEAYRRVVRYEMRRSNRPPSAEFLRELLLTRITGLDVNEEAVRLAAFSLYLAYLNFQSPQDIREAGPLPKLIARPEESVNPPVLVVADAFSPTPDEASPHQHVNVLSSITASFDVLIGNPPWDEPAEQASRLGDTWVNHYGLPVGHRNPSQQFLWRTLSLMKPDGVSALLVGALAFHNADSVEFRGEWLRRTVVEQLVDFSSARTIFFSSGTAPFVYIRFRRRDRDLDLVPFAYRAVHPSTALASSRSMAYASTVQRWVSQDDLARHDYLWKVFAWGGHRDAALMSRLDLEERLCDVLPKNAAPSFGFQPGPTPLTSDLASLRVLKHMDWWGPMDRSTFVLPPSGTKRAPDGPIYRGQRIVLSEGVRSGFGPNARLVSDDFSFRHTFYCIPLQSMSQWKAKLVLGTMLSRLGRYRMFMTSASWGYWHDKFNVDDILGLPVRLPEHQASLIRTIAQAVDSLYRSSTGRGDGRLDGTGTVNPFELLAPIDEAVYQLFDLDDAERDLVDDFHDHTLPLVGRSQAWKELPEVTTSGAREGLRSDVDRADPSLRRYLSTFLDAWNPALAHGAVLSWRVFDAPRVPMIAVVFETEPVGARQSEPSDAEIGWDVVVDRLERAMNFRVSSGLATHGSLRAVTDTSIIIARQSDLRAWTASTAREDAEATMFQAMKLSRA
jgi:hypothetical protein